MKKILVHTCCAVCFAHPSNLLKSLGWEVVSYFYNPNICPEAEFLRRREELVKYCEKYDIELILEDYRPEDFYKIAKGLEYEPERGKRCEKCFDLRLQKTAEMACTLGIEAFSTTLTISPHKRSETIKNVGESLNNDNVKFLFYDFKKQNGFKITNEIAQKEGMYRQEYCGCKFSRSVKI